MSEYELKNFTENGGSGVGEPKKEGIRIKTATGLVLVFLAVVVALGVGLIVHFAENRTLTCTFPDPVVTNAGGNAGQQQGHAQGSSTTVAAAPPSTPPTTAPTSTPPTTAPPTLDIRLPRSFSPTHYTVKLTPFIYNEDPSTFTFEGSVEITMQSILASTNVTLHMRSLNITDGRTRFSSTSGAGNSPRFTSYTVDEDRDFLIIHLDRETTPGVEYSLSMEFVGPLLYDEDGLYYDFYERGDQTVFMASTQFESIGARKAFPCFDEPDMKATFDVTLVRKRYLVSLSNMPMINSIPQADGFVEDVYKTTKRSPTYLIACIIGDFNYTSTTVPGTDVAFKAWSRPEMVEHTMYGLQVGATVTAFYNEFFNSPYPLPKEDMISLPTFHGGMENWGLITYGDSNMLFEEGVSSEGTRNSIASTVAHEVAHQWFGDLVTMEWWSDLWLNEGFATYFEYFATDMLFPEWKRFDQFVFAIHYAFDFDSEVTSHPMSSPVTTNDGIHFDTIDYEKAGSVIRMASFVMGDDTFQKGLQRYLKAHEYGNANNLDLWSAMTQQSHADGKNLNVTDVMLPWTLQLNYPVVKVLKEDGKLVVTQKRFLKNPTAVDTGKYTSDYGYLWKIPFTYVASSGRNFNVTDKDIVWISQSQQDIPVSSLKATDWVLANVHQYGFYRVNYDDNNWQALIQQLKTHHKSIPIINRAQIINDAWSLSRAGQLSTNIALHTLDYLDQELDYVPWQAAWQQFDYLNMMIRRTELYGKFQSFMVSQLTTPFKHYGMSRENSTHMESRTRGTVAQLSCSFGLPACVREAQRLFEEWMSKPEINMIDPNVRNAVYCTAVAEGDATQWEFALSQYQKTAGEERSRLMAALSCTRSSWLINRLLTLMSSTEERRQHLSTVVDNLVETPEGQMLAWDFIRENWEELHVYAENDNIGLSAGDLSGVIASIASSFSTNLHLQQLKYFLSEYPEANTSHVRHTIEKIKTNIEWVNNNREVVSDWLDSVSIVQQTQRITDVMLPRHLLPTLYEVTLKPMMYSGDPETFKFEGNVKIHMTAHAPGNNVTLHVNELDIPDDSVRFYSEDGSNDPKYIGGGMDTDMERQFRIFHLDNEVSVGRNYTIEMNFSAPLTNSMAGLYYSTYKQGNETIYMATTQFEPTDARRSFPCFDEPAIKAEFDVKLIRKSDLKSISNMPIKQITDVGNGFKMDTYERSRKMSTYLLAFIVCDFEYTEGKTVRNTTYRAWARPESVNQTYVALDAGVKILTFYEDYFNISFPLPKQDMIAIPDFSAGAMENWGLITYRETRMLYEPGVSSAGNKQDVQDVVAHELAHQWFGDLVTMKWWDDLWLNEGFASFVEYMGVDHISPDFKMFEQFILDLHSVFSIDSFVTSHPVFVPVKNPDEIGEIFDTISYQKGASVIRMMRFFLGEETFKLGLQIYLKRRRYDNADHDDLWAGLQTQADNEHKQIKVKEVMDTWIKQMNYPVVMVTKADNGQIKITQTRFLSDTEEDPGKYISPFGYQWKIPFTFTTQTAVRFNQTDKDIKWLDLKEMELEDTYPNTDWIIGNIQQYGVYRVNYDVNNWNLLIRQLKKDHTAIHAINRAQIINDAFGLAKANQLSMDIALSTLDYLDAEQDYVPWYAADSELVYIERMLQETEAFGTFQRLLRRKVAKQYARLGLNDTEGDHLQSFLRSSIASDACGSGSEECIKAARALFQQYRSNPEINPISPALKTTVYCTAVREGGEEEWQFVYDQYLRATVVAEESRFRYALTCTRKVWLINKLLDIALEFNTIRKQDAHYMFIYVSRNPVGRCVAWDYFRANFEKFRKVYGSGAFGMSNVIRGITSNFNTEFRLQQMRDFQKQYPDMGTGTRALSQAIEKTRTNINWMNKYYSVVQQWLDKSDKADTS